jgi:hypothetical protein
MIVGKSGWDIMCTFHEDMVDALRNGAQEKEIMHKSFRIYP